MSQFEDKSMKDYADLVDETLTNHEVLLDLISYGVNVIDFKKFEFHTPKVNFTMSGRYVLNEAFWDKKRSDNYETSLFCLNFAINTIFRLKHNRVPVKQYYRAKYYELKVIRDTKIILNPFEEPEVLKIAKVNEILKTKHKDITKKDSHNNLIQIIYDDETVYVNKYDVVEINLEK